MAKHIQTFDRQIVDKLLECVWPYHKILNYGTKWVASSAQKMKFSIKDFFSKYDQIRRKLTFMKWFG